MAYAITLPLPGEAAAIVTAWQEALAPFADNPGTMTDYGPHLSLAVCDGRPTRETGAVLDRLAATLTPVTIAFSGPAVFTDDVNTLYAAVVPTADLMARHQAIYNSLHGAAVHPHYTPGQWVPHCTLAMNVTGDRLGDAFSVAVETWRPIPAALDRLDLVTFPPVEVVVSQQLKDE